MKEFEEHWKCGMLSGSPSSIGAGASSKEAARYNWKAALKWVKNMNEYDKGDVDYLIEQELEN